MHDAGYQFEVISPPGDELSHAWLTIRELTIWNAARKASQVANQIPDAVVLAADTLVTIDGVTLGKPADLEDAVRILSRLSGRTHQVWTAVRLCQLGTGRTVAFQEISHVHFRFLNEAAIRNYLAKIDPLDKAGAYAAQDDRGELIDCVEGCFDNVIGLPMKSLAWALERME